MTIKIVISSPSDELDGPARVINLAQEMIHDGWSLTEPVRTNDTDSTFIAELAKEF